MFIGLFTAKIRAFFNVSAQCQFSAKIRIANKKAPGLVSRAPCLKVND